MSKILSLEVVGQGRSGMLVDVFSRTGRLRE